MTFEFQHCSVAVFAPSPILTVTVESSTDGGEVHFHAGAQGFWVARLAAALGAKVSLCVPLGGEAGEVLRSLLDAEGIEVLAVETTGANAAYMHDRRSGEREPIIETRSPALRRHELDELYGVAATAGLASDVMLLTGPRHDDVLPAETYARLAGDLRANGRRVLADLTGQPLKAALRGGLDVLKLSDEELRAEHRVHDAAPIEVEAAIRKLGDEGAASVLISRGPEPALALVGERLLEISGPRFTEVDARGAGDSMFAALAVGLAAGLELEQALRLAVAAGSLNVTRHGLGSGHLADIERLFGQVHVAEVLPSPDRAGHVEATAPIDSPTIAGSSPAIPGTDAKVKSDRDE